jgi:hypothetical protein
MLIGLDQRFGYREGDRGLAHPARSDDGQQALPPQLPRKPAYGLGASDQSRQRGRQVVLAWRRANLLG